MDSQSSLRNLQKKRTSNFREDETKLLIQLWGSPLIQNKLYLTHRKAPVMRLLAANMQHRGFYRTPDEIKTRIRNLKCLYHRIKKSMLNGTGIGTVDPDWPHFKAMDEIISKKVNRAQNLYRDNVLEGPRCEDIKQEIIEDIDINDDMESFTTNSITGSDAEFEDEAHHMPPLQPAPKQFAKEVTVETEKSKSPAPITLKIAPKPPAPAAPQPKIVPIQTMTSSITTTTTPKILNGSVTTAMQSPASMPFPLLILNGLPHGAALQQNLNKKDGGLHQQDTTTLLKNLLEVQKENLELEKQRIELEKQKLDFQRLVGTQLLTLLPVFGGLLQRVAYQNATETTEPEAACKKNGKKRPYPDDMDILKDSKILKSVLEEGIRKYMLGENNDVAPIVKEEELSNDGSDK